MSLPGAELQGIKPDFRIKSHVISARILPFGAVFSGAENLFFLMMRNTIIPIILCINVTGFSVYSAALGLSGNELDNSLPDKQLYS
jgi:hypothetical protein